MYLIISRILIRNMSKELFQILQRGYFPKELPPAFTTYTFALNANDLKGNLQPGWSDIDARPILCSIPKNGIGRRFVHVLHPLPYFFLAKYLTENYADVKRVCALSKISYSTPVQTQSLKQRYLVAKSKSVASFQAGLQKKSMDKYVELKVDVSNFYPSIYTHIIPWVFVGKDVAQNIWRERKYGNLTSYSPSTNSDYDKGNQIDDLFEKCQERQTHGIPVGPDASYLIAEAILSYLDNIMTTKYPGIVGCRYYDDYYLYFDTTEEAEKALKVLIDEFKQMGLEINLAKVEINQLPISVVEKHVVKLSPYDFKSRRTDQMLQIYFELIWSLVRERPSKVQTILKYGLTTLERNLPALNAKDENLLYILLFKTAIMSPSAIPNILNLIRRVSGSVDLALVKRMTDAILRKHTELGHHIELLWALWMCMLYDLDIDTNEIVAIFQLKHPLCTLMMLDYLHNVKPILLEDADVVKEINDLTNALTSASLYNEWWIVLYEGALKGWLPLQSIVQGNDFFKYLMNKNVSFYDIDKSADYTNASYIINRNLAFPDFVAQETKKSTDKLLKEIKKQVVDEKGEDNPFGFEDSDVESEVDQLIEDNDVKNKLFEELLHSIFAGEAIDEEEIKEKFVTLLMEVRAY